MKLDKETFVKHQFWFLLGGYFFFWLIAVLWLWSTAGGRIKEVKEAYDKNSSALKSAQSSPVNTATFLPPWEKEAKVVNGHKLVIWNDAWGIQQDMYTWPKEWDQKDMANLQTPLSTDELRRYKENLYPDEIDELRKSAPLWLNPVELASGFDSIFQPKTDWKETPTREECRLSQEDFWVKRELLLVVYNTMLLQSYMYPQLIDEKKEPKPKGVEARYRYRNQNWEITLHIRKNDKGQLVIGGDSTIKNVNPTRRSQPLTSAKGEGIRFNVTQDRVQTRFEVRGEPVGPEETRPFSEQDGVHEDYEPLDGIVWERAGQRPIEVSQGFDQGNSPIRCINALAVAKQDCRTFTWPLQANQALAQLDPVPEDESKKTEAPTGASGPGGPGGPGSDMMAQQQEMVKRQMAGGMGGGGGAAATVVNPTPHNAIERNRYLQAASQDKAVNPPSQHLPLALQLIVEQSHMQDVLVALANSRLRFQITQVEFQRAKDYVPQSESDKKGGTELSGMGRNFMGPMPGMYGGGMQQKMQQQMQMQRQMQMRMSGGGGGDMQQKMQMQMQMQKQMQMRMGGGPGMSNPMMGAPPMMPMRGREGKGAMGPSAALPAGMRGSAMQPPGGSGDTKTAAANRPDDNLVEVTVYGIATLYRRPDAPATTGQATPLGQPSPDTTPPPQPSVPPAGQPADKATPTPPPSDKR